MPCAHPANINLLKVNSRNTRRCEICSKLTIKHQNDVSIYVLCPGRDRLLNYEMFQPNVLSYFEVPCEKAALIYHLGNHYKLFCLLILTIKKSHFQGNQKVTAS